MKSRVVCHAGGVVWAEVDASGMVKVQSEGVTSGNAFSWMREEALADLADLTKMPLTTIERLANPRPSWWQRLTAWVIWRRGR